MIFCSVPTINSHKHPNVGLGLVKIHFPKPNPRTNSPSNPHSFYPNLPSTLSPSGLNLRDNTRRTLSLPHISPLSSSLDRRPLTSPVPALAGHHYLARRSRRRSFPRRNLRSPAPNRWISLTLAAHLPAGVEDNGAGPRAVRLTSGWLLRRSLPWEPQLAHDIKRVDGRSAHPRTP
jgi:hypothetical protein